MKLTKKLFKKYNFNLIKIFNLKNFNIKISDYLKIMCLYTILEK
jgi:hypothetical protein